MKARAIRAAGLAAIGLLSLASSCVVIEEEPEDRPYSEESAAEQTQDEQMDEVEDQINE